MWNFDYLDTLVQTPLRRARVFTTPHRAGPTMLFVHGGFHGAWCWAPFLQFFSEQGISSAAVDLRGHGGQEQPDDFPRQGVNDMARDVIDAAQAVGDEIILVGHSTGALAALSSASRIKPRGLILIAPAAPAGIGQKLSLPNFAAEHELAVPNEARVRNWFLQGAGDVDVAPILQRLCPESPAFMNDCFQSGVAVDPALIGSPTLCISGALDRSPLHGPEQDQAVATFLKAEIQMLPDAGHSLMLEPLWRTGAVAILDWLRRDGGIAI